MSKIDQKAVIIRERHGLPVYESNPSIPDADSIKKRKPVRLGDDKRGMIVDGGNGEILSVGGIGFYEFEEVDNVRFVKLFLAGIKQTAGLSKSGLAVFELVYRKMQENPNTDTIPLSSDDTDMNPVTYRRGLRELLTKEFLYLSKYPGLFFVNIRYMFNGDRLAFVKGYKRKAATAQAQTLPALGDMET
jgi:hypothetical protein